MAVVPFPAPSAGTPVSQQNLADTVDRYLDTITTSTTRASYGETLSPLSVRAGTHATASLTPEDYAAVMGRWAGAAAATWNRHLPALTSFTAWAQRQEILATNPARRLERRTPARRGDRAVPRTRLDKLFGDDRHGLRERVLWRMLYETAARAGEILCPNIEDLDLEFRRARITSKGDAIEYVHWATATARLLPRLLRGRTNGPVFLADRRASTFGSRAPAIADICSATGRGRLSYPRAEYLFKQSTCALDPHEQGWALHQLRNSALQHLVADGRTAPELQAKSHHQHLGSLGRYVRLGEKTSARVTAEADPAARRRTR
ncbi:tyrosine-type recombinase/integrase [Streptosporangium minutum]|uniref:Plasmid multimer resolution protein pmrA n=1 Tax=Streptosporangium minutum TaxID=569862 RepID=A0A243RPA4_9ACTN|nr:tyrosine-type recombinase/integrase [Streptosporangium minutum]OUC96792.1 plasmid multimer resolution protein pmrA [Streptosporangium minutum]